MMCFFSSNRNTFHERQVHMRVFSQGLSHEVSFWLYYIIQESLIFRTYQHQTLAPTCMDSEDRDGNGSVHSHNLSEC